MNITHNFILFNIYFWLQFDSLILTLYLRIYLVSLIFLIPRICHFIIYSLTLMSLPRHPLSLNYKNLFYEKHLFTITLQNFQPYFLYCLAFLLFFVIVWQFFPSCHQLWYSHCQDYSFIWVIYTVFYGASGSPGFCS